MAAVHAGWRGTAESILKKTIKIVVERFICSEENIYVALGPAIRGCCYHVDFDVMHAVSLQQGREITPPIRLANIVWISLRPINIRL